MKLWRYPANWPLFRYDDRLLLICMAVNVGICAGLAAIALNRSIVAVLGYLHHYRHFWWAFALPAAGAHTAPAHQPVSWLISGRTAARFEPDHPR